MFALVLVRREGELYDEMAAPGELTSLHGDPRYAAVQGELARMCEQEENCRARPAACRCGRTCSEEDQFLAAGEHHALQTNRAYYDQ